MRAATACTCSRTRRRRTAPRSAVGEPERSARPPRSASTPRRTSARSATPGRSSRTTQPSRRACASSARFGERGGGEAMRRGSNSRLDPLQAAALSVELPRLEAWNERRRGLAARYREELADVVDVPDAPEDGGHVHHLFVIRSPRRDELARELERARRRDARPLSARRARAPRLPRPRAARPARAERAARPRGAEPAPLSRADRRRGGGRDRGAGGLSCLTRSSATGTAPAGGRRRVTPPILVIAVKGALGRIGLRRTAPEPGALAPPSRPGRPSSSTFPRAGRGRSPAGTAARSQRPTSASGPSGSPRSRARVRSASITRRARASISPARTWPPTTCSSRSPTSSPARRDGRDRISVLDWGGGLGHYAVARAGRASGVELDWHCREVPPRRPRGRRSNPDVRSTPTTRCLDRTYDLVSPRARSSTSPTGRCCWVASRPRPRSCS